MSEVFEYDHAVVGAGIVGSWTALQLVRLGKKVLLLEQFSDLHTRGSSHGASRLIRSSYEDVCFAQLMPHALRMWSEAEIETSTKMMETTGLLYLATSEAGVRMYEDSVKNMRTFCPEGLDTDPDTITGLMEGVLRYDNLRAALLDKTGGVLYAHKCVRTVQTLFRERGGDLWDQSPVHRIEPIGENEGVEVHLDSNRVVKVKSVVVCAGTWTKKLLQPFLSLPAKAQVVRVYYWKEKKKGAYSIKSGFKTLLDAGEKDIYALPSLEYPGLVKVCLHGGVDCDPELRDQTPQNPEFEEQLKGYVRDHFPLLEAEPAIVETCMYTVTPDEKFIVDFVPQHKNIVIGTGFSGTGFKTAPVIGRLLSQLATGSQPFLDISAFQLSRFEARK